jgi:hypothetical protein
MMMMMFMNNTGSNPMADMFNGAFDFGTASTADTNEEA